MNAAVWTAQSLAQQKALPPDHCSSRAPSPTLRRRIPDCVGLFPDNLLSADSSADRSVNASAPRTWWLGHTLPRQEKTLANDLLARRVSYYLPLILRKSLARGRTRIAQIPLFPGYIFVCGDEADRLSALKTNRLLAIRAVPDGDQLGQQLIYFFQLIAAGAPLVRESRLVAGDRVRIKAGVFRGVEGVVLRR